MVNLRFDMGTIIIEGNGLDSPARRLSAYLYNQTIQDLDSKGITYKDEANKAERNLTITSKYHLRDYQKEALNAWIASGKLGVIVLPTGAGKTVLALKVIELTGVSTLIVVPTLVLLEQWKTILHEAFEVEVGVLGGGETIIKTVTVATYHSASLRASSIGNMFNLIVFDEVHHLPAPSNRRIALSYIAPFRLGLTATPINLEGMEELIGNIVYEGKVNDLAGTHLSGYEVKTLQIPLGNQEKLEYEHLMANYKGFLKRANIKIRSASDYLRLIQRSGRDPEARKAVRARNTAMDLALNSPTKIETLRNILTNHANEKSLIFTRHNRLVYRISRELLIPAITHQTPKEERETILDRFRSGTYRRIVTSQVLDEGIDVPDASVGVILSGTGSNREFIQRLGRILRKKEGKQAVLYELVSLGTAETRISQRRKGG